MPGEKQQTGVSRRTLVKSAALGSLALAAGGVSLPFGMRTAAAAVQQAMRNEEDKIVWGACSVNCGSRCALRLHVKDNEVWWVETDNTGDDVYGNHQVRACLRGRSIRRRINHPDRLNYPMKRVGRRGEGKFERISWQEALDTISASLKKTVETYGNEAVYIHYSSGIVGGNITRSSPAASPVKRLMNCYGGSLNQYGSYSTAQISCAMPYTYGSNDGNSTSDIENSKLVVMFGNNPAETRMSGGGITWFLEQARERSNARMIVIDPRYTDTAAGREDEWIPIRPGTDAALVAGIAWVLINENLVDQPFLDNYCIGYDEKTLPADAPPNGHYKAYILGQGEDGIAKTPQWASHITGIPADRIINKIFGNQHPGDCRRQRAIGTRANRQPLVFAAGGSVVITRVNHDHPGVGALARLFDIVCHAAAAHTCFRGVIAKHHHQFCIGDIIRTVAVVAAEHIAHGRADLGGAVATVTAEIAAAGVHQAIRYVRIGNIAAVHAGTVKDMYRFVAVVLEDTFQVIADGIQRFIPTDTFEFAFSSFTNAFHRIFQAIGMIHPATNRTAAQAGAYLMVAIFIVARGI